MPNLFTASKYKNNIITLLLKNDDFIKLINPKQGKHPKIKVEDVLLGGTWIINGKKYEEQGHIFDYNFVNDTTTEEKTFVFVETDIDNIRQNLFTDFNLYICIFTSKSLVRLTKDTVPSTKEINEMGYVTGKCYNRIDILCDITDRILNGNSKLKGIGNIEPASRGFCTIYCPNQKYYGKCLKYHITNLNEIEDSCV